MFIVTNVCQWKPMADVTKGRIEPKKILAEPAARNTAACIGYAAMEIIKKWRRCNVCISAVVTILRTKGSFSEILNKAINMAENEDKLVTIGITTTFQRLRLWLHKI